MQRCSVGRMVLVVVLFASASATADPQHMTVKEDKAADVTSVKPEAGKAALVVGRTQAHSGGLATLDTYLEKKMIGSIKGQEYFIKTDITPGMYHVITRGGGGDTVKIAFEPDCVYYIHQVLRSGGWKGRVTNVLVTPEELMERSAVPLTLLVYDSTGPDLSDSDYKQALDDYERTAKNGSRRDVGYRGVPAVRPVGQPVQDERAAAPARAVSPSPDESATIFVNQSELKIQTLNQSETKIFFLPDCSKGCRVAPGPVALTVGYHASGRVGTLVFDSSAKSLLKFDAVAGLCYVVTDAGDLDGKRFLPVARRTECSPALVGGRSVSSDYRPQRVLVSYRNKGSSPADFSLVETEHGLAILERRRKEQTGVLYETHWKSERGDHFGVWVGSKHAYEVIVPADQTQNAELYHCLDFELRTVDGITRPVQNIYGAEPALVLIPKSEAK